MGLEEFLLDRAKREGKVEGKIEEQREIAKNFKELGITVEVTAIGTGLSIAEIEGLCRNFL